MGWGGTRRDEERENLEGCVFVGVGGGGGADEEKKGNCEGEGGGV